MIYFAWFIIVLAGILFLVSLINLMAFHYLPAGAPLQAPRVSVMIPARNEEENIGRILSDLDQLTYRNLEILVYNDESEDRTEEFVLECMNHDPRVRLVPNVPLPDNWTGKNHACHRLAADAGGAYFLFLDADVRVEGRLIEDALFRMINNDLALLSIFPVQVMKTWGEKITVPLMNWILLSLLPMPLVRKSKRPSLAAANGQFMLFPAAVYQKFQLHELFKNHKVEDVAIARFLKKNGLHVDTFLGKNNVSCRMYRGLGEAIQGFTKNIFLFFGNSITITMIYAILITMAPLMVVLFLPTIWWVVLTGLIVSMRINISVASRQPVMENLLYIVPQHIVFLVIIGKGVINRIKGTLEWKGRNVLNI